MSDDDLDPTIAAWALDAVDDDERAAVEAMLRDDPGLRAEADRLREVAGALGEAAAMTPPPALRDAVLDAIAAEPEVRRAAEPDVRGAAEPEVRRAAEPDVRGAETGGAADVVPLGGRDRRRRWSLGMAAAAAVLVLALLGAALVSARDRADRAERIAAVTGDPAARSLDLEGELGGPLRVVWSEAEDAGVILGTGLDTPGEGRTLQLWFVGDDIESAAVFRPDGDGLVRVRVDGLVVGAGVALAVSEEPAGGSPAPTGDILAISS